MRSSWGLILVVACGGGSSAMPDGAAQPDGSIVADGTPMRLPCTDTFGTAMTASFGRLDGYLVAIVPAGSSRCMGDSSHMHLQVKANGAVYDLAVNVGSGSMQDVHTATRDLPMPGPAWAEGWHTGVIDDYVALGVHSTDIPLETAAQIGTDVTNDLASANHISVFATGYSSSGGHLIHRNGSGHDGLIVTQPLSSPAHARLFSFTSLTF
jgi:hypothetical protein